MTGITIASSVLAVTTANVGDKLRQLVVVRQQPDQRLERAAAQQGLASEVEQEANATWPATKKAMVVKRATGQLRKVPAKTPMAVSTIAWSQIPNSPFMKFVPKLPESASR